LYKEEFKMDELINTVANIGFPIAISVYLLIRVEGKIENLTMSIHELSQVISTKLE